MSKKSPLTPEEKEKLIKLGFNIKSKAELDAELAAKKKANWERRISITQANRSPYLSDSTKTRLKEMDDKKPRGNTHKGRERRNRRKSTKGWCTLVYKGTETKSTPHYCHQC